VEYTSAAQAAALRISGDSDTGSNTHVVIHNNTFAGFFINGRGNLFYEDGTTPRTSRLHSLKGNIHVQINTKGDVFVADGARTGNWAYLHGVGCEGEFSQCVDADSGGIGSSFAQAYPGLGARNRHQCDGAQRPAVRGLSRHHGGAERRCWRWRLPDRRSLARQGHGGRRGAEP
jgi:hypothetical protein